MINENKQKNEVKTVKLLNGEKLYTRQEAAEFLGISQGTLAVWSCTDRYPLKYVKIGRLVRYRESDLMDFLEVMTH